jgi:transcriptional regulator with XRE-family HTH domain
MTDIRRLVAANMKTYRRGLGLSQAKLAEKIDTASNYIALIEIGKRFPSVEMLERIAAALEIDTPELFSMKSIQFSSIRNFQGQILTDIDCLLKKRFADLEENIEENCKI